MPSPSSICPKHVLVIDVGGSNVKLLASGEKKRIKFPSDPKLSPELLIRQVLEATSQWKYDAISIGCPCVVVNNKPAKNPANLGTGWIDFDFEDAFGLPTKVINDATMQAIGCYKGGTMLFLGFGTGLGTTLIKDGTPVPLEGGHLPYKKGRSFEQYVGKAGFAKLGHKKWNRHALKIIKILSDACNAEDIVLGGGQAELIQRLPKNARRVDNNAAFEGGFRLWTSNT